MSISLESNIPNPPVPYSTSTDRNIYEYLLQQNSLITAMQKDIIKLKAEIESLQNDD